MVAPDSGGIPAIERSPDRIAVETGHVGRPTRSHGRFRLPDLRHPVTLRAGTSDAAVFLQVFVQRQGYFPVDGTPKFIVDAGANIGLASVCLANRFPGSMVVSLEIDPSNFAALANNCRRYPAVVPMQVGLWSHAATLAIENPEADSWAFRTVEVAPDTPGAIQAIGVADVMERFGKDRIDVLKIDIEGAENELFSADISEWIDHIGMLAIEIHERIRPGVTERVCNALARFGFSHHRWEEYWIFSRAAAGRLG